jgi:Flp pilus assembly CpaE family ATPase
MARISMPVESGNRAIKDGTLAAVVQRAAERWKPEAMYFTTFDGQRTAYMVFDLPDASGIPSFAEPFFNELNAGVELAPVMNGDDLQKGLSQLG